MTDEDFCALYETHARRLWAFVVRASGSATAADDIVQEAFVRILGARSMDAAGAEDRRRYLYAIATNLVRRRYRDARDAAAIETVRTPAAFDDRLIVERALAALPPIERQTLWLAYVEGWSWREVAAMLGYREGSIRQVAVRARRRFRKVIAGWHVEDQ